MGIINPITVTPEYLIIAGHQRYRAAVKIGLKQVPVIVRAVEGPEELEAVRINENIFRRGGKVTDTVSSIKRMIAAGWVINRDHGGRDRSSVRTNEISEHSKSFNLRSYAEKMGISVSTVASAADIAEKLIPEFQALLGETKEYLQPWAAAQLARLPKADQQALHRLLGTDVKGMTFAEAKRLREQVKFLEERVAGTDERIAQAKAEVDKVKTKAAEAKRDDIIRQLEKRMRSELAEHLIKHDQQYEDRIAKLKIQQEKDLKDTREKMLESFKKQARKGIHAEIERLRPYLKFSPEETAAKTGGLFEEQVIGAIELSEMLAPWLSKFAAALRQERGLKRSATQAHLKPVG